jgi:hypothetical protein
MTAPATLIGTSEVRLNGVGNPQGESSVGFFRYSEENPGSCNDTFGTRIPTPSVGAMLGAGAADVAFRFSFSGPRAGATYFYCAIVQNQSGIAFGEVKTLVVPKAPTVSTAEASDLSVSEVTFNGNVNPNGAATTVWFRFTRFSYETCQDDDFFGFRTPAAGPVLTGNNEQAFSYRRTGLEPGVTYRYCAIASNAWGKTTGLVKKFRLPPNPPVVKTLPATEVSTRSARLQGDINLTPEESTPAWFRYSTTNPVVCNDTFGTKTIAFGQLGNYSQQAFNLKPGTTYYYCAIGSNSVGKAFGEVLLFTTAKEPTVSTLEATLARTSLTLSGLFDPNGSQGSLFFDTKVYFRWRTVSPTSCDDQFGTATPGRTVSERTPSSFSESVDVSAVSPGTTVYFCAIASNQLGKFFGEIRSAVLPGPTARTLPPTNVTASGALLKGEGIPNGEFTFGLFRLGTEPISSCYDSYGTAVPSAGDASLGNGSAPVAFEFPVQLRPATTYYFCAVARNPTRTALGTVLQFSTPGLAPKVTTEPAFDVTATTAQLSGTAIANGTATTAWFRYASTRPASCSDDFGTRFPATGGFDVGAAQQSISFGDNLTGLASATTYSVCAFASNAVGVSAGQPVSFTTAPFPTVTTGDVTLSGKTALFEATANPNLADDVLGALRGYFRYSTTKPAACDNQFGTATAVQTLGAGTAPISFRASVDVSEAPPGTVFHYCAIASSRVVGLVYGQLRSFTIPGAWVTTLQPTNVTMNGATLKGTANPNAEPTTGYFRYSKDNTNVCNDTFGTRVPASGGTALGSGTGEVPFEFPVNLEPATIYFVCAMAQNASGIAAGRPVQFSTSGLPPTVASGDVTQVLDTTAQLSGTVTANGTATTAWFRFGTTKPESCNDNFGARFPTAGGIDVGSGNGPVSVTAALTGLQRLSTYYFCTLASNSAGTSTGLLVRFETGAIPAVASLPVGDITGTSATLRAQGNPGRLATTAWFRVSATDPGSCNDSFGTRWPAGDGLELGKGETAVDFSVGVAGLKPGSTSFACAIASNAAGVGFGSVTRIETPPAPNVSTKPAESLSATEATLRGVANAGATSGSAWFRYGTEKPVHCNDSFGARTPAAGIPLSAGIETALTERITGLTPGTSYYFCALASNSAGVSVGEVERFTTSGVPTVTTSSASELGTQTATLNGSALSVGVLATAYFRYATTNPGVCSDSFGTRFPATGGVEIPAGKVTAYKVRLSNLQRGATYYFCALASNVYGSAAGELLSFSGNQAPPQVVTVGAEDVGLRRAALVGRVNPSGSETTAWFRYSDEKPADCNDTFGTRVPETGGLPVGKDSDDALARVEAVGLKPGKVYHVCAIAANAGGAAFGQPQRFETLKLAPSVRTTAASIDGDSMKLTGLVNTSGLIGRAWFQVWAQAISSCSETSGVKLPVADVMLADSDDEVVVTQSSLKPQGTLYYCAVAETAGGKVFGSVQSLVGGPSELPGIPEPVAPPLKGCGCSANTPWIMLPLLALWMGRRKRAAAKG